MKLQKMSKISSVKETQLGPKLCLLRQSWTKYLTHSKIGQVNNNVISNFACFLTALTKLTFWKKVWAPGYVSTQIVVLTHADLLKKAILENVLKTGTED